MKPSPLILLLFLAALTPGLSAQSTPQAWQQRGRTALAQENYLQALEDFRSAIRLNPNYLEAHEGLAEAFFALGDFEEAGKAVTQAMRLGTGQSRIMVLQGRVLLGQGKFEEGLRLFQDVLAREPKNLGAFFGRAEYYVLTGRFFQAQKDYQDILKTEPLNLRAHLAQIILGLHQGRFTDLPALVESVLKNHSTDPLSHWWASQYHYRRGNLTAALNALDNYIRLRRSIPSSLASEGLKKGLIFRTVLLLSLGRWEEAVITGTSLAQDSPEDPYVWYLKGLAEFSQGDSPSAMGSFLRSLRIDSQNETSRIALENILLESTSLEEFVAQRKELAEYHFNAAQEAIRASRLTQAYDEIRRGLQIHPDSVRGFRQLTEIFKTQGFLTSYRDVLKRLERYPTAELETAFKDEMEIQFNAYPESLPALWSIPLEDFEAQKPREITLGIFYQPQSSQLEYFSGADHLSRYFQADLGQFRNFSFRKDPQGASLPPQAVENSSRAFSLSRQEKLDFYLLLEFREGFRDITAVAHLHQGSSGRLLRSFPVYRKGLGRVTSALRDLSKAVRGYFPQWGLLVKRDKARGLISLGSRDGVAEGAVFRILKAGAAQFTGDGSFVRYSEADTLGTFTVTLRDDRLSEGTLAKTGFYDLITPGDEVIFVPEPKDPLPIVWPAWSELHKNILSLR